MLSFLSLISSSLSKKNIKSFEEKKLNQNFGAYEVLFYIKKLKDRA